MTTSKFRLYYQTRGYDHCCGVAEIGGFHFASPAAKFFSGPTSAVFAEQKDDIVAGFKASIDDLLTAKDYGYMDDEDNWVDGGEVGPTCLVATVTHVQDEVEEVLVAAGFKLNFEFRSRTTGSVIRHYYITTDMLP